MSAEGVQSVITLLSLRQKDRANKANVLLFKAKIVFGFFLLSIVPKLL